MIECHCCKKLIRKVRSSVKENHLDKDDQNIPGKRGGRRVRSSVKENHLDKDDRNIPGKRGGGGSDHQLRRIT